MKKTGQRKPFRGCWSLDTECIVFCEVKLTSNPHASLALTMDVAKMKQDTNTKGAKVRERQLQGPFLHFYLDAFSLPMVKCKNVSLVE